jgi:hypothetical protein
MMAGKLYGLGQWLARANYPCKSVKCRRDPAPYLMLIVVE